MPTATLADIRARIGEEIGVSPWITIDQPMIDAFADVTGDPQFIHVDPVRAAQTPFGGTVAHGFLTLSLLSQMASGVVLVPQGALLAVNYGFERVRFIQPVRSGSRVRGRFVLTAFDEKKPGQLQFAHAVTVEIDGDDKPALTADWIGQVFV